MNTAIIVTIIICITIVVVSLFRTISDMVDSKYYYENNNKSKEDK